MSVLNFYRAMNCVHCAILQHKSSVSLSVCLSVRDSDVPWQIKLG